MKVALRRLPASSAFRWLDLWLIAILVVGSFAVILRIGLRPADPSAEVAVIYSPWTTADQTMVRGVGAGARFVRFGGFDFSAIVVPAGPTRRETCSPSPRFLRSTLEFLRAVCPPRF